MNETEKRKNETRKRKIQGQSEEIYFVVLFRRFAISFRLLAVMLYALLHIYQLYFEPRSLDITMLYSTSNALPDNQFFVSSLHAAHMFLKLEKTKSIFDIWTNEYGECPILNATC